MRRVWNVVLLRAPYLQLIALPDIDVAQHIAVCQKLDSP